MKQAEEANRGKVRKEIGGKLNPGKLARPALLRGFRPFCEDFGGEGGRSLPIAHCWKAVGEHSESQLLSNPPPIALNSGTVLPIGCKCQFKDTHYHLFQWEIQFSISFNGELEYL